MTLALNKYSVLLRLLEFAEIDANWAGIETFINGLLAGTAGYAAGNALKLDGYQAAVGGGAGTIPAINSSGDLLIGVSWGGCHTIVSTSGSPIALMIGQGDIAAFYPVDGLAFPSANAAATALKLGSCMTGRSINAAGTINAAGADYAEYEVKASSCSEVSKGQVIGFDAAGKVTDKWSDAISFGVKSTNPNLVGGDSWGSEDVVGKRPEQPIRIQPGPEQVETTPAEWAIKESQYQTDLAAFEVRLEAERRKVDRIAYSGKVPCNVEGSAVGDYIIAAQDSDGIKGIPVAAPTFEQYQKCVGRVRAILEDGRPEIAVIVH